MKSRKLLMIPGPIEFEPQVLQAMGQPTTSHVAPDFIASFGHALKMMRDVWQAPNGQPFIIAGSGTLAMDIAGANLIETGDNALVISSGYFGERYFELLKRYGANVDILRADLGHIVSMEAIDEQLSKKEYKLLTFTHVDTSTAILNDAKAIGALGKKHNVLTILDGVCSVASEEIKQEEWGLDVVLTASQKAVGVPPGLALLIASQKAMTVWKNRKTPVSNYYGDWSNWLPIMQAYESGKPSYFGTPAVNLVQALEVSLKLILNEGLTQRFQRHKTISKAFRNAMSALGLTFIGTSETVASNTLTAPYFPKGIKGSDVLTAINKAGVITAGGLLGEIKSEYFRVGHMGAINRADILATIGAIETALQSVGHKFETGIGLKAAMEVLNG